MFIDALQLPLIVNELVDNALRSLLRQSKPIMAHMAEDQTKEARQNFSSPPRKAKTTIESGESGESGYRTGRSVASSFTGNIGEVRRCPL